jgi:uncharacterized protein (DUF1499 family)
VKIIELRRKAPNPPGYDGPEVAAKQRAAYPDIVPLELPLPVDAVFARALATAKALGWEIVAAEPAAGRIEAVDTTRWLRFKDDVVIRIAPRAAATGTTLTRVDVRSKSRTGRSDLGANAARIRRFLQHMRDG